MLLITAEQYAAGDYPKGVAIGVITSGVATGQSKTK